MQNVPLRAKPAYPIEAVDNALHLLQLLRDNGTLRLKDAAAELHVAPSTAHRLLAMLVYRGFAVQDDSRGYLAGPAMGVAPAGLAGTQLLRSLAQTPLELLSRRVNESVNLMVRVGTKVRFLSTIESTNALRVGDRQGAVLPAHRASGGKAMLAELDPHLLEQLFRNPNAEPGDDSISDEECPSFLRELDGIRSTGFAANLQQTEDGINAIGMALHSPDGLVTAAISVAMPAARFRPLFDGGLVATMHATRLQIEEQLASR